MGIPRQTKKRYRNIVGPQIAQARVAMGLTQDAFAAKLQIGGLDNIDNIAVSKIENQVRSIFDYELQIIAHSLKVSVESLYPPISETKRELSGLKTGYQL